MASEHGEQHELRWKDRWLIISDRLLADGSVVHLSIDITDHKRAELALGEQQVQLCESQAQLSAVLRAVPDLWFVLDAEGRYLKCSSEHHPMLAHSWDSVRGKPFDAGVPKPLADRVVATIARALASNASTTTSPPPTALRAYSRPEFHRCPTGRCSTSPAT